MTEYVILVNENDQPVGTMEKMEAHQKGLLHRAFSVFVFNETNEMLLQQRAFSKYHSAGLWTNTCCSHPRPGEELISAAKRRLKEEMGIETELTHQTSFIYKTDFDNDLTEHELDHVFVGKHNESPVINKDEVNAYKWISLIDLRAWIKNKPQDFTSWFKIVMQNSFPG
ncbi:MAG: isopentenyl-diphosphate Delta-isomerase [Bacteroidota bacterium]|jgi:isopentenyl-diphosphate delta-isomerase|nr:isopentenyl-diphosphate Delta-isomerase [Bacteroidota bacterium]MCA6443935.1 isopentenyl-diphosphate Delta-isomerase [Bacteroidota bacterium]